jgi:hypothetical protein
MGNRRSMLVSILLSVLVGCGGEEEGVALRCVEESEAVTFLILLDEGRERATLEANLPGWGEVGSLLVTETQYQISVPIPSAGSATNQFSINRITGNGQVSTVQQDGDAVRGGPVFSMRCERYDLSARI